MPKEKMISLKWLEKWCKENTHHFMSKIIWIDSDDLLSAARTQAKKEMGK